MYLFELRVFSGYTARSEIAGSYKGASLLNFLEVTLAGGGGACNNRVCATTIAAHLSVCTSLTRSSNLWSRYRSLIFGEEGTFCLHWLQKLCESCTKVAAENGCNFTSEPFPDSCKSSTAPQFQNSYIRFCHCICYLGGETDSWCLLLHLPRILSRPVFGDQYIFSFIVLNYFISSARVLWRFCLLFTAFSANIHISVISGITRIYVPHLKGYFL